MVSLEPPIVPLVGPEVTQQRRPQRSGLIAKVRSITSRLS